MPQITTDEEFESYSPLFAYLDGKDSAQQDTAYFRFGSLSDAEKKVLVGTDTAETIAALISTGTLPQSHGKAVAKLIYFVLADEVPAVAIQVLLGKLGLTPEQAQKTQEGIIQLIQPIITERAQKEIPQMAATEMPPMTRPTENGPRVLSPQPAARNIIDLRKTRPTDA